ncbi:hypothetical protein D9M69_668320 [compost metagenome]
MPKASAGRVRCQILSHPPSPLPKEGNQPRPTEKSATRAMAATKGGTAPAAVRVMRMKRSLKPLFRLATIPANKPRTVMKTAAKATSCRVVGRRPSKTSETS